MAEDPGSTPSDVTFSPQRAHPVEPVTRAPLRFLVALGKFTLSESAAVKNGRTSRSSQTNPPQKRGARTRFEPPGWNSSDRDWQTTASPRDERPKQNRKK